MIYRRRRLPKWLPPIKSRNNGHYIQPMRNRAHRPPRNRHRCIGAMTHASFRRRLRPSYCFRGNPNPTPSGPRVIITQTDHPGTARANSARVRVPSPPGKVRSASQTAIYSCRILANPNATQAANLVSVFSAVKFESWSMATSLDAVLSLL